MREQTMNNMTLTHEEHKLTDALLAKIKQKIENSGGSISFAQYMQMALYDREYGYYTNKKYKLGALGDFITAPNLSGLFGLCISNQIKELWQNGVSRNILEFGAGNGRLMIDLLAELGNDIDTYYIIETSPNLRSLQQELLHKSYPQYAPCIKWLDNIPQSFDGVIIANELLDAMPCEMVKFTENEIFQVHVSINQNTNNLNYYNELATGELLTIAKQLPIANKPYLTEISLTNRSFMQLLGNMLDTGAILLIDYGHAQNEYYHPQKSNGTLRGFFRHQQLYDVLEMVGLIDITANVDFSAIYNSAHNAGLELIGYTTQSNFLINCGLTNLMKTIKQNASESTYLTLSNQANRLISPNGMGEIFKVIGFSKNIEFANWCGFKNGDKSYLL